MSKRKPFSDRPRRGGYHVAYAFKDGQLEFAHTSTGARKLFDEGGLPLLFDEDEERLAERLAPHVTYLSERPYLTACVDRPMQSPDDLAAIRARIIASESR